MHPFMEGLMGSVMCFSLIVSGEAMHLMEG